MKDARTPKPRSTPNNSPPVVCADELYTFTEICARLRWRRHSRQQARRLGLKTVRFGSRDYVLGRDLLAFFDRLAQKQHAASDGGPDHE